MASSDDPKPAPTMEIIVCIGCMASLAVLAGARPVCARCKRLDEPRWRVARPDEFTPFDRVLLRERKIATHTAPERPGE